MPTLDQPDSSGPDHNRLRFVLNTNNIYLIGMRGSGKTTVGRALAHALGCALVDTDALIVQRARRDIATIVSQQGWTHFRTLEHEALAHAATLPGKVVATGGGVILTRANCLLMRQTGICFYLAADAALLAERLSRTPDTAWRPPLTGLPQRDEIAVVLAERESLYRAAMDHCLPARRAVDELVHDILAALAGNAAPLPTAIIDSA